MTGLLKLRPYQAECIEALYKRWDAGDIRVPSVLATGLGKTIVFAHTADRFLLENPLMRVLVLAHTTELVDQAVSKMRAVAPHHTIGIVKGSRNETNARIVVASRQTLGGQNGDRRRAQIHNVGLIIVDECHHATKDNTYGAILEHYGAFGSPCTECKGTGFGDCGDGKCWDCQGTGLYNGGQSRVKVAGFTATLARGDAKSLATVWQPGKTFVRDIGFGIRHGFLLDVKGKRVIVPELDLKGVKKQGGDYQADALADELIESYAPELVAQGYGEHASDRQGIVFVPNVASAYVFAEAFNDAGISAEVVHGALAPSERSLILKRLLNGDTRVIVNCMVLTEGFDAPCVSCVVVARPTRSAPLYQQMVGRALRPQLELAPEDRGHAIVIDVVGASHAHDLRSLVDLSLPEDPYDKPEDEEPYCFTCDMVKPCLCVDEEAGDDELGFEPDVELYAGPVKIIEFDPLGRDSEHAWQKTSGGHFFLAAGKDAIVFLVPETDGTYGVAWCTAKLHTYAHRNCPGRPLPYFGGPICNCPGKHNGERGGWANGHRNLSLEAATSFGMDTVTELAGLGAEMLTSKKKAWRKSKDISGAQIGECNRLGIEITETMRKGDVSDAIGRVYASRRVDPVVGALIAIMERENGETA